jgi:acyl carrier protein
LAKALRDRGQQVVVATVATTFKQTGTDRYRMNPDRPDDFRSVLEDVSRRGPCLGIVHLWGLDAVLPQDATTKENERAHALGLRSVTHLLNALHHVSFAVPPRIWLIDQENGPTDAEAFLDGLEASSAVSSPPRGGGVESPAEPPPSHGPASPHGPGDSGRLPTEDGKPLEDMLIEQVGEVLNLRGRPLSTDQPLRRMGLDSLMSVELRHRLERQLDVRLSLKGPLGQHTISAIAENIRELSLTTS